MFNDNRIKTPKPDNISSISTEKIQLLWWLLVMIASTIFFKLNYFDSIYRGGFSIAIENYLTDNTAFEYVKTVFLIFVKSIAEIVVFVLFLYIFSSKIIRINQKVIIIISILIVSLIGVANQLSLLNVGSLMTFDSFMITFDWMKDNPGVISYYINKKNLVYFMLMIFMSILPILASSSLLRTTAYLWLNRLLALGVAILIFMSISLYVPIAAFMKENTNLKPLDGYWSSLASSLIKGDASSLANRKVLNLEKIRENYTNLIYPTQNVTPEIHNTYTIPLKSAKKHIIIIGLETAPQKYYPIINNPKLKNFYKMSKSSIVTDMHFTNSPYTFYATYSILSGTYVPPEGSVLIYKDMSFNGLGNILPKYGYLPTFIDSYYIDWHGEEDTNQRVLERFGFNKVFDRDDYDYKHKITTLSNKFEKELYAETISFKRIIQSIDNAIENNKKSLLFVSTSLGHFKWKAKEGNEHLNSEEKIFELASTFDDLFGKLLTSLKERNLENDVIIVITGDHGLRYHEEYESLDEKDRSIAVSFNVPLMIYLPGLLKEQIKLNHITSHIDLAPTLLELVGVDISNYFFHGENVLNPKLKDRMVFMMNQSLKPESSYYKKNIFYTYNDLSTESYTSLYGNSDSSLKNADNISMIEISDTNVYTTKIIQNAKEQFNDLAAYYLRQKN